MNKAVNSGPSSPQEMPLDILLRIAALLDGRSLAAFGECTSRDIAESTTPHLASLWKDLLQELPCDELAEKSNDIKADYVRAWALTHTRCPRCGKKSQSRHPEDASFEGYTQSQQHLCEWFSSSAACRHRRTSTRQFPQMAQPQASLPDSDLTQQSLTQWLVPHPGPAQT